MDTEENPPNIDLIFEKIDKANDSIIKQTENENKTESPILETVEKIQEKTVEKKIQTKKNRCFSCNKKVGYTGMECRCKYVFCGFCRYPEKHSCTFDFKAHGKKILEKQSVKIVNNKFEKL